jgi:integrase
MPQIRITKTSVDAVPTPDKRDEFYWDDDRKGPLGFGLRVTPAGARSYVFQYRLPGQAARRTTIGRHGPWTPDQARERAKELKRIVDTGVDPVEVERERQRQLVTLRFDAYVDTFTEGYLKTDWGDSWPQAKRQLEMHVIPHIGKLALPKIGVADLNPIFDALRARPALQRNVFAVLRKLFNWAEKRDDIARSPMVKMDVPKGVRSRRRILSPDELVAVWQSTYSLDGDRGAFVRLLMITLQRRSEVSELVWNELAQDERLWRLPEERAKNDHEHLVPLSDLAMSELDTLGWKSRGLVMKSSTGKTSIQNFSDIKTKLDETMLPILQALADARADEAGQERHQVELQPWRIHDIRRTGTTHLQALGFPIEVGERVINHHQGGETSGIRGVYNLYEYLPEKTAALQSWASRLKSIVQDGEAALAAHEQKQSELSLAAA